MVSKLARLFTNTDFSFSNIDFSWEWDGGYIIFEGDMFKLMMDYYSYGEHKIFIIDVWTTLVCDLINE